jgi:hypothetical protein
MQGDTVCDSIRPPERLDEQAITLKTPLQGVNECNGDVSPLNANAVSAGPASRI